jgi:hypothetical protein
LWPEKDEKVILEKRYKEKIKTRTRKRINTSHKYEKKTHTQDNNNILVLIPPLSAHKI